MWCDLTDRFHQSNRPWIFQIKKQLVALQQGSLDINSYYTLLKILWDELRNFQPIPVCSCGGLKIWTDHQHQECVMQFFMGLNDSVLSTGDSSSSATVVASSGLNKNHKDTFVCTHCKMKSHTKDRCYKLNGYPPNHKSKYAKDLNSGSFTPAVAACNKTDHSDDKSGLGTFSTSQYKQLIALLTSQLQSMPGEAYISSSQSPSMSSFSGLSYPFVSAFALSHTS